MRSAGWYGEPLDATRQRHDARWKEEPLPPLETPEGIERRIRAALRRQMGEHISPCRLAGLRSLEQVHPRLRGDIMALRWHHTQSVGRDRCRVS